MQIRSFSKILVAASALCAVLAGCTFVSKPTDRELEALDFPPAAVAAKMDRLLPRALAWYVAVEAELLPQGRALSASELEAARGLGVANPERVRVVVLEQFPMPGDPELLAEAKRYGLDSRFAGGRTNGYLVMLKPSFKENAVVLRHELVHVAQHERMGPEAYLRRYLVELEMMGYARAPLELEAYSKQGAGL